MTWYAIQLLALVVIVAYMQGQRQALAQRERWLSQQDETVGNFWKRYNEVMDRYEQLRWKWRVWRRLKRKRYAQGYRAGQLDAANGKWKYELRDQPDGSRVWTETERGK